MASALLAALLAAAPARAEVKEESGTAKGLKTAGGPKGFPSPPRCPRGTKPVSTPGSLQPHRCVRDGDDGSYARFSIPREFSFEYPRALRIQDAWKEEVPTLYLSGDDGAAGKPVAITISRFEETQATFQAMDAAIAKDIDWQGARDGGAILVAGAAARLTFVAGQTRTVYIPLSKESYYCLVYSAPADSYESYLPAFSRLLKSLRLDRSGR